MGIKDTEQDQTMMDRPERSSHTDEGRTERGMNEMGRDREKIEIWICSKSGNWTGEE